MLLSLLPLKPVRCMALGLPSWSTSPLSAESVGLAPSGPLYGSAIPTWDSWNGISGGALVHSAPRSYQIGCLASKTAEVEGAETEAPVRVVTQKGSVVGGVARLGLCDVRGTYDAKARFEDDMTSFRADQYDLRNKWTKVLIFMKVMLEATCAAFPSFSSTWTWRTQGLRIMKSRKYMLISFLQARSLVSTTRMILTSHSISTSWCFWLGESMNSEDRQFWGLLESTIAWFWIKTSSHGDIATCISRTKSNHWRRNWMY